MTDNKIINGFWIGDRLSNIQKLCVRSFQDNGHQFRLWSYNPVEGVPEGAVVVGADQIVPWGERLAYKNDANFSDYFRSCLTLLEGGCYVDMDIVCLKPFDFPEPRVFVSEYQFGGSEPLKTTPLVNGCILKIPACDPMTYAIISRIHQLDPLDPKLGWCAIGPDQYRWGVKQFNYSSYVQKPDVFDSLWPTDLTAFVQFTGLWHTPKEAKAIHLRTSYWKPGSALDPNGTYHPETWFEKLKRKHGVK